MEPFRVFTTVKYTRGLASKSQSLTHFWGSRPENVSEKFIDVET
jgi:hypothetical protein